MRALTRILQACRQRGRNARVRVTHGVSPNRIHTRRSSCRGVARRRGEEEQHQRRVALLLEVEDLVTRDTPHRCRLDPGHERRERDQTIALGYGNGRSTTASRMVKIAVAAPMPNASV